MGTGKTLAAFEALEDAGLTNKDVWYVGPKAGVRAVSLELDKWFIRITPERMLTYNGLVSTMSNWMDGLPAPRAVIFDESSKIKNPTAKRSQAAKHLAEAIRAEHGRDGYIILMTGTPAPRTPVDFWHQCEIVAPGYLREGNVHAFRARLSIIKEKENPAGGVYPQVVSWLDDERKCAICGQFYDAPDHDASSSDYHAYKPSKNEVAFLYERLKGVVIVKFKKDCLDLPEKQYRIIQIPPTPDMLRVARTIQRTSSRAIEALTRIRELADGFQYTDVAIGEETCQLCDGRKTYVVDAPIEEVDSAKPLEVKSEQFKEETIFCPNCGGKGLTTKYQRSTSQSATPKDEVFVDMLDEHEDIGRFTVWGGFTGTIDRLVDIAHQQGWCVLRIDGRGFVATDELGNPQDENEFLKAMDLSHPSFQDSRIKWPKICVVGQPEAGGMALTLTASPTELYYSNSFNGEARSQSEDRGHRAGMDANRAYTIVDILMMPTDQLVLNNLKKKRRMEKLSMGEIADAFAQMGKT
jgi:hypothetical protein